MRGTPLAYVAAIVLTAPSTGWGQQCSDWSTKFNQIDDSAALQQLQSQRNQGWPSLNPASNGGVNFAQLIAQDEQLIQQWQQAIRRDQQIWSQIGVGPKPSVTAAQCKTMNQGVAMAAVCAEHTSQNALFTTEGILDLLRCRAGLPSLTSASPETVPSEASPNSSGSSETAWQLGAASVADLNVAKRGAMVSSATSSWQAPTEMRNSSDALSQSAALADPFAENAANGLGSNNSSSPTGAARSNIGATIDGSGWSDPLAPDNNSAQEPTSRSGHAEIPPNQEEIAKALDSGVLNSGEVSPTPMATVADASNWDNFVSSTSGPSSNKAISLSSPNSDGVTQEPDATDKQIDQVMAVAGGLNKLNPSEISGEVSGESIGAIESAAHQENHLLNDFSMSIGNDISQEQLNSDVEATPSAIAKGLPGYKYIESINNDINTVQKAAQKVSSGYESFKNYLFGPKVCPLFQDCSK